MNIIKLLVVHLLTYGVPGIIIYIIYKLVTSLTIIHDVASFMLGILIIYIFILIVNIMIFYEAYEDYTR
jgi:hypothetical protein